MFQTHSLGSQVARPNLMGFRRREDWGLVRTQPLVCKPLWADFLQTLNRPDTGHLCERATS